MSWIQVACGLLILGVLGGPALRAGSADGKLDVYWIDVEGGAATLIVTPAGESILIDTGNPGFRDPQRIVKTVTELAGLRRIDHLVITHYHGDHYGGAAMLSTLLPIGTLYDNGEFPGMPDRPSADYWQLKCERRVVIQPGDRWPLKQTATAGSPAVPVSLTCLGTRQKFLAPTTESADNATLCASARMKDRDGTDNANSVVLLLQFGDFRLLDAGDLTWNREQDLVCPKNLIGEVDVYQVTHHGLDSSNNPLVVRSVRPTVAVMNNGHRKGCLPEVLATLRETPSIQAIYQVHKNLRPDGDAGNNVPDEYIANRGADTQCQGHPIRLSVEATGRKYQVQIAANQHQRTFATQDRTPNAKRSQDR